MTRMTKDRFDNLISKGLHEQKQLYRRHNHIP